MNLAGQIEARLRNELAPHLRAMAGDVQAYLSDGWSAAEGDPVIVVSPDGRHVATVVLELARPDRRPPALQALARLRALGKPEVVPNETRSVEAKFVYEDGQWQRKARWRPSARSYQDLD